MGAVLVLVAAAVVVLVLLVALLGRRERTREPRGPDYGAMADVEARDVDDMLDAIDERRRRGGRRSVGDELADELTRTSWERR